RLHRKRHSCSVGLTASGSLPSPGPRNSRPHDALSSRARSLRRPSQRICRNVNSPRCGCPIQALLGWGRDSVLAQTPILLSRRPCQYPRRFHHTSKSRLTPFPPSSYTPQNFPSEQCRLFLALAHTCFGSRKILLAARRTFSATFVLGHII